MSWFPEPKFQIEWLDRCSKFDQKMEKLSHLNEEEKSQLVDQFNRSMKEFLDQRERSRK